MRSARGARAVSMRPGSFILPAAASRGVRVSDAIGADEDGDVLGDALDVLGDVVLDGDDGVVEVTPGLVVDGEDVDAPGLSVVVDGRSGFVDCAPAAAARHSSAAPSMNLDLYMVELLWKVGRSNMLPHVSTPNLWYALQAERVARRDSA